VLNSISEVIPFRVRAVDDRMADGVRDVVVTFDCGYVVFAIAECCGMLPRLKRCTCCCGQTDCVALCRFAARCSRLVVCRPSLYGMCR
jgi:hypothetical protein